MIAIAEVDGVRAGIGRLQRIDEKNAELGGILVLSEFRGGGVARQIVRFLLEQSEQFLSVFCIPFEHLVPFYSDCGFHVLDRVEGVPLEIQKKLQWCGDTYENKTTLMILERTTD